MIYVMGVPIREIGMVGEIYKEESHQNCCHQDFTVIGNGAVSSSSLGVAPRVAIRD